MSCWGNFFSSSGSLGNPIFGHVLVGNDYASLFIKREREIYLNKNTMTSGVKHISGIPRQDPKVWIDHEGFCFGIPFGNLIEHIDYHFECSPLNIINTFN